MCILYSSFSTLPPQRLRLRGRGRGAGLFLHCDLRSEWIDGGTFAAASGDGAVWVLGKPVGDMLRVAAVPAGLAPREGLLEGSDLLAALGGALRAEHQSGVRTHREEAHRAPREGLAALRTRLHLDDPLGAGLPREGGDGAQVGVVAAHDGAVADPRWETLHMKKHSQYN